MEGSVSTNGVTTVFGWLSVILLFVVGFVGTWRYRRWRVRCTCGFNTVPWWLRHHRMGHLGDCPRASL